MDSAKLTRSCERLKEHYKMLKEKRSRSIFLNDVKIPEKTAAVTQVKCIARTLEDRQCTFNATHGKFCKKHFSMV
jgi:hypothetical protein